MLIEKIRENRDVITVIASVIAVSLSVTAFIRSFPDESKIDLRPGTNLFLYNHVDYPVESGLYDVQGILRLRIPLTVINTGGKSEVIDKISIKLTNKKDTLDQLILDWQAFMKAMNETSYTIDELPAPMLIAPKSSVTKLIVFTGGNKSKNWKPALQEYSFQIFTQLAYSNKTVAAVNFNYQFTDNDTLKFGIFKKEGIGRGIWISPDYLKAIK